MKIIYSLLLCLPLTVNAAVDINKDCAAQYQPILDTNNNDLISGFVLASIALSNEDYAESLFPVLIRNEKYAFLYARRFAIECLTSKLTVEKVVDKMFWLDEL